MPERTPRSLHRLVDNKNDWDDLLPSQMNRWQKVAKATRGIVTIGNAITTAGTYAVIDGINRFASGQKAAGTAEIIVGRLADVVDGIAADVTGTKGRVGRAYDPFVGAVQLGVAVPVLHNAGALPLGAAIVLGVSKGADAVGTVAATVRKLEINPTREGKYTAAAMWTGIGSFILQGTLGKHAPDVVNTALEVVGWTGTVGGAVAHLPATIEYNRIGFGADDILPNR